MSENVGHHFEHDNSEPHCFACRKPIEIDALVVIRRLENTHVWWHEKCAPRAEDESNSDR